MAGYSGNFSADNEVVTDLQCYHQMFAGYNRKEVCKPGVNTAQSGLSFSVNIVRRAVTHRLGEGGGGYNYNYLLNIFGTKHRTYHLINKNRLRFQPIDFVFYC